MQKEGLTVETADYLTDLLKKYEETEGGLSADAVLPPIPVARDDPGPPKPAKFLVPTVILWDPLSQVPKGLRVGSHRSERHLLMWVFRL